MKNICVICGSDELNTTAQVELDGVSYKVYLCDEHSDSVTMKAIKNKLLSVKMEFERSVVAAMSVGIISESQANVILGTESLDSIEPPEIAQHKIPPVVSKKGHKIEYSIPQPQSSTQQLEQNNTEVVEESIQPTPPIPGGKFKIDNVPEELHDDVEEMQNIIGRGGQKISIPKRLSGSSGSTDIHVSNVGDEIIQKRLKSLNSDSPNSISEGYRLISCTACGGSGVHPVSKNTCPKCDGSGYIV